MLSGVVNLGTTCFSCMFSDLSLFVFFRVELDVQLAADVKDVRIYLEEKMVSINLYHLFSYIATK